MVSKYSGNIKELKVTNPFKCCGIFVDNWTFLIVTLAVVEHKLEICNEILLADVPVSLDLALYSLHVYRLRNHLYNINMTRSLMAGARSLSRKETLQ